MAMENVTWGLTYFDQFTCQMTLVFSHNIEITFVFVVFF